jgi:hypothetical protein
MPTSLPKNPNPSIKEPDYIPALHLLLQLFSSSIMGVAVVLLSHVLSDYVLLSALIPISIFGWTPFLSLVSIGAIIGLTVGLISIGFGSDAAIQHWKDIYEQTPTRFSDSIFYIVFLTFLGCMLGIIAATTLVSLNTAVVGALAHTALLSLFGTCVLTGSISGACSGFFLSATFPDQKSKQNWLVKMLFFATFYTLMSATLCGILFATLHFTQPALLAVLAWGHSPPLLTALAGGAILGLVFGLFASCSYDSEKSLPAINKLPRVLTNMIIGTTLSALLTSLTSAVLWQHVLTLQTWTAFQAIFNSWFSTHSLAVLAAQLSPLWPALSLGGTIGLIGSIIFCALIPPRNSNPSQNTPQKLEDQLLKSVGLSPKPAVSSGQTFQAYPLQGMNRQDEEDRETIVNPQASAKQKKRALKRTAQRRLSVHSN